MQPFRMDSLKSLIYISLGNLPSKWAHTGQIANMAQSLSRRIENFSLLTGGDVQACMRGMDEEFKTWYGLERNFRLVRLPVHVKVDLPFPENYSVNPLYVRLAVLYACMRAPSLVYTRTIPIAKRLLRVGLPVLWEWHGPLEDEALGREFFQHPSLIGVVTTSPRLVDEFGARGLSRDKALMVPNAVELTNFLPYQSKEAAREALAMSAGEKIILYSGHLYDYKGVPTILEVARRVPDCKFLLVGGWEDDVKRVRARCEHDHIENVVLTGHVPKSRLATYMYAADVLLIPTSKLWKEAHVTNPLKLFEYMAVRRPIVASDLPNISSVLRNGENALLAESDDPDSFHQAVRTLIENPRLAADLAESAYVSVQNFTWDHRAEAVLNFAGERLKHSGRTASSPVDNLRRLAAVTVESNRQSFQPSVAAD